MSASQLMEGVFSIPCLVNKNVSEKFLLRTRLAIFWIYPRPNLYFHQRYLYPCVWYVNSFQFKLFLQAMTFSPVVEAKKTDGTCSCVYCINQTSIRTNFEAGNSRGIKRSPGASPVKKVFILESENKVCLNLFSFNRF